MERERMQVLEMVAAGTVTTEQANRLLEALGDTPGLRTPGSDARLRQRENPGRPRGRTSRDSESNGEHGDRRTLSAAEKLEEAARYGLTGEFIRELQEMGITDVSFNQLIQMARYGVTADYIREMHNLGFTDISLREMVRLRKYGVEPSLVQEMRELGIIEPAPTPEPVASVAGHFAAEEPLPQPQLQEQDEER